MVTSPAPNAQPELQTISSYRELRAYVREDYAANDRSIWSPGFQALLANRLGTWHRSIRSRPLGRLVRFAIGRLTWMSHLHGIELSPGTRVGHRVKIAHRSGIIIHHRAVIGDECLIRQGVTIGVARSGPGEPAPVLGRRVSVGAGAVIAGGVRIGDDAVIGPNTVVMSHVPAGSMVTAPPSRIMPPPRRPAPRPDAAPAETESPASTPGAGAGDDGAAQRRSAG